MRPEPGPSIVAFLCTWCAYRAADLVGTTRRPYASTVRPLRVICTARVGPELVLKTLLAGADGVLIVGCHPGECHRTDGNVKAYLRTMLLRKVLSAVGIDRRRVKVVWAAASEGTTLVEAADGMTMALSTIGCLNRRTRIRTSRSRGPEG